MKRALGYLVTTLLFAVAFGGIVFLDAAGYATKAHQLRAARYADWISGRSRADVWAATAKAGGFALIVSVGGCAYLEWQHRRAKRVKSNA
jgi:hypothetical protein